MRGYAPTAVPADGAFHLGALAADVVALHEVLGGSGDTVLIGHDWGARRGQQPHPRLAHLLIRSNLPGEPAQLS